MIKNIFYYENTIILHNSGLYVINHYDSTINVYNVFDGEFIRALKIKDLIDKKCTVNNCISTTIYDEHIYISINPYLLEFNKYVFVNVFNFRDFVQSWNFEKENQKFYNIRTMCVGDAFALTNVPDIAVIFK